MRILVISGDNSIGGLCYRFIRSGNEVKIYIDEEEYRSSLDNMIVKVDDWKSELDWVGKDGMILFDTTSFGEEQNNLRAEGYIVVGGSKVGDMCENDREFGQKIMSQAGIHTIPTYTYKTINEAITHIQNDPAEWVIKHDGEASMISNYIGEKIDGTDAVDVLKAYDKHGTLSQTDAVVLQKRVRGIEIGVARYFNGKTWIGPIEFNIEHKDLCTGGLGPKTWEMGTLMWFGTDETNLLYQSTLAKLETYLRDIDFRGDIDINCIINESGVMPLELTMRFGFPALQLQAEMIRSPFEDFLHAVGSGITYQPDFKSGYGVVVLLAVPPFPYDISLGVDSLKGTKILFKEMLTEQELSRINFEDVSCDESGEFYIAGENGFVLHVSGSGESVEAARESAYSLIRKINVPKMFYRTDIGLSFMNEDKAKLKEWGWL